MNDSKDKIYKAGHTELTRAEVEKIYNEKKYVCNYNAIYQPHYSTAQQDFYFSKISNVGLAQRGRFYTFTAKEINDITGRELLHED